MANQCKVAWEVWMSQHQRPLQASAQMLGPVLWTLWQMFTLWPFNLGKVAPMRNISPVLTHDTEPGSTGSPRGCYHAVHNLLLEFDRLLYSAKVKCWLRTWKVKVRGTLPYENIFPLVDISANHLGASYSRSIGMRIGTWQWVVLRHWKEDCQALWHWECPHSNPSSEHLGKAWPKR